MKILIGFVAVTVLLGLQSCNVPAAKTGSSSLISQSAHSVAPNSAAALPPNKLGVVMGGKPLPINPLDTPSSGSPSSDCPSGYVLVPGSLAYSVPDFCVAAYVASQSGAQAASVGGQSAWVNLSKNAAISACQANGPNYDLISNAEWQTIAQNIELVSANWSSGTVGSGALSFGTPFGSSQAATPFTLSNSNVVYDIAGNVFQWVKDVIPAGASISGGSNTTISQLMNGTNNPSGLTLSGGVGVASGDALFLFGPSKNYAGLSTSPLNINGTPDGGLGWAGLNATGVALGGIVRGELGGNFYSGIFAVNLGLGANLGANSLVGFRCVYHNNSSASGSTPLPIASTGFDIGCGPTQLPLYVGQATCQASNIPAGVAQINWYSTSVTGGPTNYLNPAWQTPGVALSECSPGNGQIPSSASCTFSGRDIIAPVGSYNITAVGIDGAGNPVAWSTHPAQISIVPQIHNPMGGLFPF